MASDFAGRLFSWGRPALFMQRPAIGLNLTCSPTDMGKTGEIWANPGVPMADAPTLADNSQSQAIVQLVDRLAQRHEQLSEQRSVQRYPFNIPVSICGRSQGGVLYKMTLAWAREISYEGIGLLTTTKLMTHRIVFANFEPAIGKTCYIPIRLLHSRKLIDGVFSSGGQFIFDEDDPESG